MTESQTTGTRRGAAERLGDPRQDGLERRRTTMQSAEGHAGSVPRGNPEREEENIGHRRDEYERVLGH